MDTTHHLVRKGKSTKSLCETHSLARRLQDPEDDTNPLFISAVRIFLDYVRDQHNVPCPEKCTLDQLIGYLGEFQEVAKTKKGERYSPSTIRVIRYSLNRVITLGKNQLEMRPYPTQSNNSRKRPKPDADFAGMFRGEPFGAGRSAFMTGSGYFSSSMGMEGYNGIECTQINPSIVKSEPYTASLAHGVAAFRGYLCDQLLDPKFETFPPSLIKEQLENFLHMIANTGKVYTPSSMQTMRCAVLQYLQQQGIDLERGSSFTSFANGFRSMQSLPHPGKRLCIPATSIPRSTRVHTPETAEWLGIPVEQIKEIYRTGTLSVSSAQSLQWKVWFELTVFFRGIPCCPDQMFWNKKTFKISADHHGVKYVQLNPEMYNRYGYTTSERSNGEGRIMVQRVGSPYCPVASFEMYIRCLDTECDLLFTQPEAGVPAKPAGSSLPFRFTKESLSTQYHSSMMARIAEAAKLKHHFSNLSVSETDHLAWTASLIALELELQCQSDSPSDASCSSPTSLPRHSVIQSAPARNPTCKPVFPAAAKFFPDIPLPVSPHPRTLDTKSSEANSSTGVLWKKKVAKTYVCEEEKPELVKPLRSELLHKFNDWCSSADKNCNLSGYNQAELDVVLVEFLQDSAGKSSYKSSTNNLEQDLAELVKTATRFDLNGLSQTAAFFHPVPHRMLSKKVSRSAQPATANPLTLEDITKLYASGVFDINQPETLQNKVLFELVLSCETFFHYPMKLRFWLKRFFTIVTEDGKRRVTASAYAISGTKGYPDMLERDGEIECPVRSYERYASLLSGESTLFFPECLRLADPNQHLCWYGTQVGTLNDLNERLNYIAKQAGLGRTLSQADVAATGVAEWSKVFESAPSGRRSTGSSCCSKPTTKHVLERYRRETASEEALSDASSDCSGKMRIAGSPFDDRKQDDTEEKTDESPIVVVRPQIVIVNRSNGILSPDDLKQRIREALATAISGPEWENQISRAIKAAEGNNNATFRSISPDSGSSFIEHELKSCRSSDASKSSQRSSDYGALKLSPRGQQELFEDLGSGTVEDLHSALHFSSHESLASFGRQASSSSPPVNDPESHGSTRRKAFKPTRH